MEKLKAEAQRRGISTPDLMARLVLAAFSKL